MLNNFFQLKFFYKTGKTLLMTYGVMILRVLNNAISFMSTMSLPCNYVRLLDVHQGQINNFSNHFKSF